MATIAAQQFPQPWAMKSRNCDSPKSDASASAFSSDASDKVRVTPTMEDIRAALNEHHKRRPSDEYQSSEEALSPLLGDDAGEVDDVPDESRDEVTSEERDAIDDFLDEYDDEPFDIDIAVALRVFRVGKPKIINITPRWASHPLKANQFPSRADSLPPSVPSRSGARAAPPNIDTRAPPASSPDKSTESLGISPDSVYQFSPNNRNASIFPGGHYVRPEALTPPSSEHDSDSPAFLKSDPYERDAEETKKKGHSRLRSLSIKFKKNPDSPKLADEKPQKPKKEFRLSITNLTRPPTPPSSFFNSRSSDESADGPYSNASFPGPMRSSHNLTSPQSPHASVRNFSSPATSPTSFTSRPAPRRAAPKMVARGPTEREPILTLPPCPTHYDQDIHSLAPAQPQSQGGHQVGQQQQNRRSSQQSQHSPQPHAAIYMTERPRRKASRTFDVMRRQSSIGLGL